jgi:hypothetical protein
LILADTFTNETSSGWQKVTKLGGAEVAGGDTYRVSVNTNAWQAKTLAYFLNNPINRPWGVADMGYYGQPTGSRPTTSSYSSFFVDVFFRKLLCFGTLEGCVPVQCP